MLVYMILPALRHIFGAVECVCALGQKATKGGNLAL